VASEIIVVPDLGGAEEVEVIEVSVAVGDSIEVEQTLVVLESDKATMEIPAPLAGKVIKLLVKEGDKIEVEGVPLVELEVAVGSDATAQTEPGATEPKTSNPPATSSAPEVAKDQPKDAIPQKKTGAIVDAPALTSLIKEDESAVYAGPLVRKLAREMGVDFANVKGSGPRGRILKEDIQVYVKSLTQQSASSTVAGGSGIPPVPDTDFSQFGDCEVLAMTKIEKLTAANMHRSWLNAPHVTQFDDATSPSLKAFANR